jgi:hypothetical protein
MTVKRVNSMSEFKDNLGPLESNSVLTTNQELTKMIADQIHKCTGVLIQKNRYRDLISESSTTQKGALSDIDGRWLFVKKRPEYLSDNEKTFSAEIQHQISCKMSEVPSFITCLNGEIHFNVEHDSYYLMNYIEGKHFSEKSVEIFSAGKMLAKLHSNLLNIDIEKTNSKSIDQIINSLLIILKNSSINNTQKSNFIRVVRNLISSLSLTGLKEGALHGDYAPFNLIFDEGEVKGITDFDNSFYGAIVYDIASGALTFSSINYKGISSNLDPNIMHHPNAQRIEAFLLGYMSVLNNLDLLNGFSSMFVAVWVEHLILGVIRKDFTIGAALNAISNHLVFSKSAEEVIEKINKDKN